MPNMNRIRVNNVKYNFGTQQYDDFVMRLHGKNTIYDLANGGGKSVLLLLLLQNLIPNCTLDEKQPIEKLFRTSGGSTTIHSLVEWNLDEAVIEDNYRFMLTGFCARRARGEQAEEDAGQDVGSDTAAIEYFNYCIFYRAYNANDLVNLPLVKDKERITYSELRTYLKELERTAPELKVYLFDRKGEYQQFISRYGLYESAWEIIRGINRTEGHVRTYFESNYKTTRKVVEDLLIEGIIETSFRDKTQEDTSDSMAKTLLAMKDKLMELSEKKSEIRRYEHQRELLGVLSGRVQALKEQYAEKDAMAEELCGAYRALQNETQQEETQLLSMKQDIAAKAEECANKAQVIACLKVQQEEYALQLQEREENEALRAEKEANAQCKEQERRCRERENANEYLEYSRLKVQRDAQQATVDRAKEDSGDNLERLYDYAAVKKQFMQERLAGVQQRQKEAQAQERELKISLKSKMNEKREMECELAVCQAEERRLNEQCEAQRKVLSEQKKEANVLLLEDVGKTAREQKKQLVEAETALEDCVARQRACDAARAQLTQTYQERLLEIERAECRNDADARLEKQLQEGAERVGALAGNVHCDAVDPFSAVDVRRLCSLVEEQRHQIAEARMQEKGVEKQQEQLLKALEDGLVLTNTEHLQELCEYLVNRHALHVRLCQEYLLEKEPEQREEILRRWPFAPYGLVLLSEDARRLSELLQDFHLRSMTADRLIPILTEEMLQKGEYRQAEGVLFLQGETQGLGHPELAERTQKECAERLMRSRQEQEQLARQETLLEQDFEFLLRQHTLAQMREKEAQARLTQKVPRLEDLLRQREELERQLEQNEKELETCRQEENACRERVQSRQTEWEQLCLLEKQYTAYQQLSAAQKEQSEQAQSRKERLHALDQELETSNHALRETREQEAAFAEQLAQAQRQWDELYAEYDCGRPVLDLGYTEEQLDAQAASLKTIVERGLGSVADKRALVDTLNRNMEQLLRSMKRRNADLEALQKSQQEGTLHLTGETELEAMGKERERYRTAWETAKTRLATVQRDKSRCEGRIEHGMKQLEEQGIHYTRLRIEPEDLRRALEEQEQLLVQLTETKEELTTQFIARQKQHSRRLDFGKDIKRTIDLYHLKSKKDGADLERPGYTLAQLRQRQADFEKAAVKEQQAIRQMEEYKQQTAQTLEQLQAYELAEVIRRDVVLPETAEGLQELIDSLQDMTGFIQLEQERVEQGIADMQMLKGSFEKQCLRRCQDVKTELERLPRLSGITLDKENIQMISLKIPYVSEEEAAARMSDYVDRIARDVDRYDTASEKMRYIRSQLALKRLFSVVVRDMDAIRLNLYKRERIREQSRYLRYEEAVGSTGQSQGIYIQFLIAVINYIANIYSINSDNASLSKVIFLDNPFGAAKDVYIWEPIFEMLRTNNVQLIVPARGATPAITGRFDVNYILGQKLVGGKQQTVVVDYRSQVEQTELEYRRLEFTQNSFDFI